MPRIHEEFDDGYREEHQLKVAAVLNTEEECDPR
jgi:hypothetical protein